MFPMVSGWKKNLTKGKINTMDLSLLAGKREAIILIRSKSVSGKTSVDLRSLIFMGKLFLSFSPT